MVTVVEFDYTDEKTPVAEGCPGCGRSYLHLNDTEPPPSSYATAWREPVLCRGTSAWHWCKQSGDLTFPGEKRVQFFPDRRRKPRG